MAKPLSVADIKKSFQVDIADLKALDRVVKRNYSKITKSESKIEARKAALQAELKSLDRAQKSSQKIRDAVAKFGSEKAAEIMRKMV